MQLTVQHYYNAIDSFAPFSLSESWDNAGILIGSAQAPVQMVLLALDITPAVISQAKAIGAGLIITHHPIIFSPLRSIAGDSLVYSLITAGISVISAHTNLDNASSGGVNDALAACLKLQNIRPYPTNIPGRIGELAQPLSSEKLALFAKESVGAGCVRYTPTSQPITTVALCGGSASEFLSDAKAQGAGAYITGETRHHHILQAVQLDICLIELGHFASEQPAMPLLKQMLEGILPDCEILLADNTGDGMNCC